VTDAPRPGRSSQTQRSRDREPSEIDTFGLRFSQLVRICGLVIAVYQGIIVSALHIGSSDPVAMGGAATMMSGSLVADYFIKRRKGS
jgi:hypothetical protein